MRDSAKPLTADPPALHEPREEVTVASDPLLGQTIDGRYHIDALLGEGGMGLVYRATHTALRKQLAIKVLRPDVSRDEEVLQRFRQEAQSASAIGNEHIVDISDFGMLADGSTYFVMEYLEGIDLIHLIEDENRLDPERAMHIARQLSRALGAAHAEGIVHRDLKPENVYLIRRGRDQNFVKVLDFGIAKVGDSNSKLTRAGEVFGTPHYMSPEQCAGTRVDHRTDIYSLGVMLYEMVTGDVPHDADNMMGILTKHIYEEPKHPSELVDDMLPSLEHIILRCLHKDVALRYQTMAEVEHDLIRIENGEEVEAPPSWKAPRKPRRVPWYFALTGIASLAILATLVSIAVNRQDGTPPLVSEAITPIAVATSGAAADDGPTGPRMAARSNTISVVSAPEAAEVWAGDELLGKTPIELERSTIAVKTLTLKHKGYKDTPAIVTADTDLYEVYLDERKAPRRRPRVKRSKSKPAPSAAYSELEDPWKD